MAGFGNCDAWLADAARIDGGPGALAVGTYAVESTGDNARGGSLADAAHAGQHEGVRDPSRCEGVAQRLDQSLLPDEPGEVLGPVFPRQHAVGFRAGGLAPALKTRPAPRRSGVKSQTRFLALVHD